MDQAFRDAITAGYTVGEPSLIISSAMDKAGRRARARARRQSRQAEAAAGGRARARRRAQPHA